MNTLHGYWRICYKVRRQSSTSMPIDGQYQTYPSRMRGISSNGPETRNTVPLIFDSVAVNMALCTTGPTNETSACTLCSNAYTDPDNNNNNSDNDNDDSEQ